MLLLLLFFLGQRGFLTFLGRCCCSFIHSSLRRFAQVPLCYVVMLLFPYFLFDVSVPTLPILDWYFPHYFFANVGRTLQIQIFRLDLEGEIFFPILFC